jgi:hypothetical protein
VFRKLVGTNPWAWRRQFSSGPRTEPMASGNHAADVAGSFESRHLYPVGRLVLLIESQRASATEYA